MRAVKLLCVMVALCLCLGAGKARVDVIGAMTPGQAGEGVQVMAVGGAGHVAFQMDVETDQWKPMTFRFTPQKDGQIELSLRGAFNKGAENWVYYDAIEVTGATLANGDFEEWAGKNTPTGWQVRPGQFPAKVADPALVQSGKASIKVSHGNRVAQSMNVTAGTEVTITLQARFDKRVEAK